MSDSRLLHVLVITIAIIVVYANSIGGDFVYDDKAMILGYDLIKEISNLPKAFISSTNIYGNVNYYRPLQTASYMVDYFLWGSFPAGFHATNIIFHIVASFLVYFFTLMLFKRRVLSFVTALIFAVHPVNTGVVAYIAGRADAMALIFILACLMCYLKAERSRCGAVCYFLSLILFASGLLVKESAMMVPFLVLFMDCYGAKWTDLDLRKTKKNASLPFFAILGLYLWFRFANMGFFVEGAPAAFPLFNRVITAPYAIGQYLRLALLPNDLHIGRELWVAPSLLNIRVILSVSIVAGIFCLGHSVRTRSKALWFGLLWFIIMIFPALNIITPLFYTLADNWLYAPSVGLYLALVSAAGLACDRLARSRSGRARHSATALAVIFIVALGAVTVRHNLSWKDEIAVGTNTLKFNPYDHKIYNNMGVYYLGKGDLDLAEKCFRKCLEVKPDTGMAYLHLYRIYVIRGDKPQAIGYLEKARKLDPARVDLVAEKLGIKD